MNNLMTSSRAVAASVLVSAAMAALPAGAAAHTPSAVYRQHVDHAMPAPPRVRPLPPVSRGSTVVLRSDPELDRFEQDLAGT